MWRCVWSDHIHPLCPIPTKVWQNTQTTMSCPCCRRWSVSRSESSKIQKLFCYNSLTLLVNKLYSRLFTFGSYYKEANTLHQRVREQCILQTYFTDLHRKFKSVTITVEWWTIAPRVKSLSRYFSGWAMVFFAVITFHEVLISLVFDLLSQTLVWSRYSCVLPWLVDFQGSSLWGRSSVTSGLEL